jgi:pimeloyl-ACP methyl ester carboxylesterase
MSRVATVAMPAVFVLSVWLALVSAQSATELRIPPMPGRLVATDAGHRLHMWCTGEGSPTVVLVNGAGSFSIDWALIQPAIAAKTRVCSYDRAGYAWSDSGPAPRGVGTAVAELHQVLVRAGERGPYLLVGSSWGGIIARVFAHAHPDDVAGVVLADTTPWGIAALESRVAPEESLTNLDSRAEEERAPVARLPADVLAVRAWALSRLPQQVPGLNITPAFMSLEFSILTEPDLALGATTVGTRVPLGDTPLVVISAGRVSWDDATRASFSSYAAAQRAHIEEQARLAALSRNSTFVVARGSFHAVQFYEPELITNAVVRMLTSALTGAVPRRPQVSGKSATKTSVADRLIESLADLVGERHVTGEGTFGMIDQPDVHHLRAA